MNATIQVALVHGVDGASTALAHVAFFPAEPFTGTSDDPERRFMISLHEQQSLIESLNEFCARIALIDTSDQRDAGELEGYLEMISAE